MQSHELKQMLLVLEDERRSIRVDGDASFQRGFFMGYECAQRVIERLLRDSDQPVA